MAKGDPNNKGAAARAKYNGYEQASFVQFNPDKAQQAAVKAWPFDPELFETALNNLIDDGYKITFRFDDFGKCYAAWILSPRDHEDNPNLILSGRGSSPIKAFKQALWAHLVLYDKIWPKPNLTRKSLEFDD